MHPSRKQNQSFFSLEWKKRDSKLHWAASRTSRKGLESWAAFHYHFLFLTSLFLAKFPGFPKPSLSHSPSLHARGAAGFLLGCYGNPHCLPGLQGWDGRAQGEGRRCAGAERHRSIIEFVPSACSRELGFPWNDLHSSERGIRTMERGTALHRE